MEPRLFTPTLERAFRWSARHHAGQMRRGSNTPYVVHLAAVALILARAGFDEHTLIAGLLHDVVEDTSATLEEVVRDFGHGIAATVHECSEIKLDANGVARPWIDRKRDHVASIPSLPLRARAVILADKLHNLSTIEFDLAEAKPVWDLFHAPPDQVLAYHQAVIAACGSDDPRLARLAEDCRLTLARIAAIDNRAMTSDAWPT